MKKAWMLLLVAVAGCALPADQEGGCDDIVTVWQNDSSKKWGNTHIGSSFLFALRTIGDSFYVDINTYEQYSVPPVVTLKFQDTLIQKQGYIGKDFTGVEAVTIGFDNLEDLQYFSRGLLALSVGDKSEILKKETEEISAIVDCMLSQ